MGRRGNAKGVTALELNKIAHESPRNSYEFWDSRKRTLCDTGSVSELPMRFLTRPGARHQTVVPSNLAQIARSWPSEADLVAHQRKVFWDSP